MKINIHKIPCFENDSYVFTIKDIFIPLTEIRKIRSENDYFDFKFKKFLDQDITTDGFENFLDKHKKAIGELSVKYDMLGTIYTRKVEYENLMQYKDILNQIKQNLQSYRSTSRNVVRFANSFKEYNESITNHSMDVSCLNLIQYSHDSVNIVFRASDLQNELYEDIITIYAFFLYPVYSEKPIDMNLFLLTSQNIFYKDLFSKKLIKN